MSKVLSIVVACAAIAGGTAYGLYSYTDVFGHRCGGCPSGHVNATVASTPSPCCESGAASHDDSCADACCATKAKAAASCCASSAACCPAVCCEDAAVAVAGPAAVSVAKSSKVSTAAKASCCANPCPECVAAACAACPTCAVCCGGSGLAVAGPAAMFVSTVVKAKKSACCEAGAKAAAK